MKKKSFYFLILCALLHVALFGQAAKIGLVEAPGLKDISYKNQNVTRPGTNKQDRSGGHDFGLSNVRSLSCNPSDQCIYKVTLQDSYGDGWQGARFGIRQDGALVATFGQGFTSGYSFGPINVPLCHNKFTEVYVISEDGYNREVGFRITNPFGVDFLHLPFNTNFVINQVVLQFTTSCQPVCAASQQCIYTAQLTDSGGDGWEGCFIGLRQGGQFVAGFGSQFTNGYSFGPVSFSLCPELITEIIVTIPGRNAQEVGFVLRDPWGNILYRVLTGNISNTSSLLFNFFSICSPTTCYPPANVTINTTSANSAAMAWHLMSGVSQWDVSCGPAGTPPGQGTLISGLNTPNCTITGLMVNTNYSAYVRSVCPSKENSVWSGPHFFKTPPCHEDDRCNYTAHLTDTYGDGWDETVIGLRQNGVVIATFGEGFNSGSSFGPVVLPLCDGFPTEIIVLNAGYFIDEKEFEIFDPLGQQAFFWPGGGNFSTGQVLHTFSSNCPLPSVLPPTNFNVVLTDPQTAYLSWTPNANNDPVMVAFNINNPIGNPVNGTAYAPGSPLPGGGIVLHVGTITHTVLNNLTFNTLYHFASWSVNEENEYSTARSKSVQTPCGAITPIYVEDFSQTPAGQLPSCWSSNIVNSYGGDAISVNQTGVLVFQRSSDNPLMILVTPEISTVLGQLLVKFDAKIPSRGMDMGGITVGTLSDPLNYLAFNPLETIYIGHDWDTYTYSLAGYTGTDRYIGFKFVYHPTTHYLYMDDILIGYHSQPVCPPPSNLGSANHSSNQARLSWAPGSSETKWELQYGLQGFALGSGILLAGIQLNPFVLQGLNPATSYDFYVRAVCGSQFSTWSGPHTFVTHPAVLLGDANCDGTVNVLDIITMVNYIMVANPEPFCFANADVNSSLSINVLDIIGVVNIIMNP